MLPPRWLQKQRAQMHGRPLIADQAGAARTRHAVLSSSDAQLVLHNGTGCPMQDDLHHMATHSAHALLLDPSLGLPLMLDRTWLSPQPTLISLAAGQVVARALHEAGVKVHSNTSVTAVRRLANGSFSLALREEGDRQFCEVWSSSSRGRSFGTDDS